MSKEPKVAKLPHPTVVRIAITSSRSTHLGILNVHSRYNLRCFKHCLFVSLLLVWLLPLLFVSTEIIYFFSNDFGNATEMQLSYYTG